jgi:hypothetical protein
LSDLGSYAVTDEIQKTKSVGAQTNGMRQLGASDKNQEPKRSPGKSCARERFTPEMRSEAGADSLTAHLNGKINPAHDT